MAGWPQMIVVTSNDSRFRIMDAVAIASDTLNYKLPVGRKGYITSINHEPNTAFKYLVRVPERDENWWVPDCDLMPWDEYLDKSINDAILTHKINDALDRKDAAAFEAVTNEQPKG